MEKSAPIDVQEAWDGSEGAVAVNAVLFCWRRNEIGSRRPEVFSDVGAHRETENFKSVSILCNK